jgi:hypothetical protein
MISAVIATATTLLITWLAWNIYHFGSLSSAIRQTLIALDELFSAPDPAARVVAITKGYTDEYLPVVRLRLFTMVFNITIGTVLSVLACVSTKFEKKFAILAAVFFTVCAFAGYATYAQRWADKAFIYTVFPVAVLISWFILDFRTRQALTAKLAKAFKLIVVSIVVFLIVLVPLLMYSHMAFVYPPSTNSAMLKFLARNGRGSLWVIGGHTDVDYIMFAEEASLRYKADPVPEPKALLVNHVKEYNLIAISFRAYTKDAFVKFDPPLNDAVQVLKSRLSNEYGFAIVYCADKWHDVYWAP